MKHIFVVLLGMSLGWGCSDPPLNGQKVFVESGCPRCHEADGSGGSLGPPLTNLKDNWTAGDLDQFLADPPSYMLKDKRLQKYQEMFFTPMPKLAIDPKKRGALVLFLLKEKK